MINRFNIYGGPGSGKSTLAAELFVKGRQAGLSIELITEQAKNFVWNNKIPNGYDQLEITISQIQSEQRILKSNPNIILISDSPPFLGYIYAEINNLSYKNALKDILTDYEQNYKSINTFLPVRKDYNQLGRFQNYNDAILIENKILEYNDLFQFEKIDKFLEKLLKREP